ncbi:hypothetical protein BDM02DRAFT_3184575 [Thelephora ganbajun]|uniref:Uncharacterized protein n=1 Tax=Thelephora ganbajun TaxID=370292 RepID=A0ACB6ZNY9_THEGA|nr:hypothetical protein BDM02DRAFT_3184575 [Thelephora ganbajun]
MPLDQELGELQVRMMELELAWEQWDAQVSSGYVSVEDAAGEGKVIVEEENAGEENFGMDEEQLWSPSSSDRAVLALVPDTSAFPTQYVYHRANTAENEDEDFSDLGLNDFVLAQKVTARRKLECLQGNIFNMVLLEQGLVHAMEGVRPL